MRLWRERGIKGVRVPFPPLPPNCDINPLTQFEHPCYSPHRSNTTLTISRRNQKLGKPTRPTRGLNASAHPNGPHAGPAAQAKVAISSSPPGPVPLPPSLTLRRWKTPWTVPEKSPHGATRPTERNGAARSRGPLGSPSASQINWAAAVSRLRDIVGQLDTPYSCEGN